MFNLKVWTLTRLEFLYPQFSRSYDVHAPGYSETEGPGSTLKINNIRTKNNTKSRVSNIRVKNNKFFVVSTNKDVTGMRNTNIKTKIFENMNFKQILLSKDGLMS